MQKGASAARRDEMHIQLVRVVAVVVVPIAGDHRHHVRAFGARNRRDLEEVLLLVEPVHFGNHPRGLGEADDEVVALLHLIGHGLEVVDLGGIEILRELDVGAPDPPVVGQAQRPVAAVLLASPAAYDVALGVGKLVARRAEQAVEGVEPVVPVVVAGDGKQLAVGLADAERPVEGLQQALLVFLARGLRVALVAAHDQDFAVPQLACAAHVETVLGEEIGRRIGGLEAIADVRHVVDPEGARTRRARCGFAPCRRRRERRYCCSRSAGTIPCRRTDR